MCNGHSSNSLMFPRRSCLEVLGACVLLIRRLVGRWTLNLMVLWEYTFFIGSSKKQFKFGSLVNDTSTLLLVLQSHFYSSFDCVSNSPFNTLLNGPSTILILRLQCSIRQLWFMVLRMEVYWYFGHVFTDPSSLWLIGLLTNYLNCPAVTCAV